MLRKTLALVRAGIGALIVAVTTLVIGSAIMLVAKLNPRSRRIETLARAWARVFLFVGGARLTVAGRERIDQGRSYVLVSNHLSEFDIAVNFLTAPVGIRFLAKKELYRIPVFGSILKSMGMVETDRQAGVAAHEDINRQIEYTVSLGHSLMIYPEGTRSRVGELAPFKKGAFRIAIDNQMDVVPISIHGTYEAWAADSPFVYGGPVSALVHEPIPVAGLTHDDIDTVKEAAYEAIHAGLNELKAG